MRRSTDKLLISFVMLVAVCLYAPTMLSDRKPTSVTHVEAQADTEVQYMSEEITYEEVQSGGSETTETNTTDTLVAETTEMSTTETLIAETTEMSTTETLVAETTEMSTTEALVAELTEDTSSEEITTEDTSEESSTQELTTETVVEELVAAEEETTETIGIAESAVGDSSILDSFLNQEEEAGVVDQLVAAKSESKIVYPKLIAYIKTLPCEIKPSCIPEEERLKAEAVRANEENFSRIVETYMAAKEQSKTKTNTAVPSAPVQYASQPGDGVLTASKGVNYGPSGKETYYNLNMNGVISIMESMGYNEQYWVREDGVKMYGDYVMVAADLNTHPRGSLVESSLGTAIVVDTGGFAASDPNQLDIATAW